MTASAFQCLECCCKYLVALVLQYNTRIIIERIWSVKKAYFSAVLPYDSFQVTQQILILIVNFHLKFLVNRTFPNQTSSPFY